MWSSKMSPSWQIVIFRYSQTKQIISLFPIVFFCFCFCFCFCSPPTARIFGTNWPISMGSVVKGSFANNNNNSAFIAQFQTSDHCALQKYTYKIHNLKLHKQKHQLSEITRKKKGFWGCGWYTNMYIQMYTINHSKKKKKPWIWPTSD